MLKKQDERLAKENSDFLEKSDQRTLTEAQNKKSAYRYHLTELKK